MSTGGSGAGTDGAAELPHRRAWVWPGAVAHYLREHDVPPDPDFVPHIRARGFAVPDVTESAKDRAIATVTG